MKKTTSPSKTYLMRSGSCLKRPIKVILILGVIGLMVIVGFFINLPYSGNDVPKSDLSLELRRAPDFELKNSQGKKIALKDFRERYVILHFWAGWCAPCLAEISQWVERANRSRSLPIQWVAISLDQSWQDVHKILPSKYLGPNLVSLLDLDQNSNQNVADRFGTFQFPETYLLSPDHKILKKWIGPQDWTGTPMDEFLRSLSL